MNAPSPISALLQTRGLKSLWDMYEISAQPFINAIQTLAALEKILPSIRTSEEFRENKHFSEISEIGSYLAVLVNTCDAMGAKATVASTKRLIDRLNHACTAKHIEEALIDIRQRFKDELEEVSFLFLENRHKIFYEFASETFGFDVAAHFSSAVAEEIDEAGKCLALDCNTACIFHLMRAMEDAVKVLGAKVGVANVEKEWGKILSDLATKIEAMPKGSRRDEWSACHVNFYHVKQAWRNSTMHPKKTYTPDQALEVFDAVRAFMRHLSILV